MDSETPFILIIGLLMVAGLAAGTLASRIGLPRVVGFVLAGMLFSPDLLGGLFGRTVQGWSAPWIEGAVGIIAYLIGGAMTTAQLRRSGRSIASAAVGESLGAVLAVFLLMLWLTWPEQGLVPALAFAALAATTDPAGSVAVIHQYRARGKLTRTLLGVAALDDALGIVLFALMMIGLTGVSLAAGAEQALLSVAGGILLGIAMGKALVWSMHRIASRELHLPVILAAILMTLGLAKSLTLSPLLAAMALGFSARHLLGSVGERVILPMERLEEVVFLLFFTLAGAQFDLEVFTAHLDLVAVYFLARVVGKIVGARLGTSMGGAPPVVSRWLGLTLIPQAGVAVGLAMTLAHHPAFRDVGPIIVNVVLANTFLCEAIGPLAARYALTKAGEIGEKRGKTHV